MEITEPVLTAMRDIRDKSDYYLRLAQRLQAPYGAIPAGNEHNLAFVRGESLAVFLRELQRGTVEQATEKAKAFARESFAIGNRQRPDADIRHWEGSADSIINCAASVVRDTIYKVLITQPIELLTNPSVHAIL